MIFIGLEISSIATYVLAGYLRDDKRNNEAALKYFLLGSFATAFFLYGVALIYGITGIDQPRRDPRRAQRPDRRRRPVLVGFAAALMFVGLGFKVSGAPFQIWAPDVYQGAPAPVSAFLSAGPESRGFRHLPAHFPDGFRTDRLGLGAAGLDLGAALHDHRQFRRADAIECQAPAGVQLHRARRIRAGRAGRAVGNRHSRRHVLSGRLRDDEHRRVRGGGHLSGKGEKLLSASKTSPASATRQPMTAAMLTIFLLSLIGVPLTGGFFGKFYIFRAALESNLVWLAVLGLLNSAVAAYYYLRILVVMYMHEPSEAATAAEPLGTGLTFALVLPALGIFFLGIFPTAVLNFAGKSAVLLRR